MRTGVVASAVDHYRRTIRWAWLRDEVQETATREKVLYFVALYGSWFVVMIGVGLALQAGGYASAAEGVWFFGIWFSAFMASIDIAWEGLGYLLERRDERAGPRPEPDSRRELGRPSPGPGHLGRVRRHGGRPRHALPLLRVRARPAGRRRLTGAAHPASPDGASLTPAATPGRPARRAGRPRTRAR